MCEGYTEAHWQQHCDVVCERAISPNSWQHRCVPQAIYLSEKKPCSEGSNYWFLLCWPRALISSWSKYNAEKSHSPSRHFIASKTEKTLFLLPIHLSRPGDDSRSLKYARFFLVTQWNLHPDLMPWRTADECVVRWACANMNKGWCFRSTNGIEVVESGSGCLWFYQIQRKREKMLQVQRNIMFLLKKPRLFWLQVL